MFKRIKAPEIDVVKVLQQFPHCDQKILHAPGECHFCDMHPEWQALRVAWGIAFTGWTPEGGEFACPADVARPHVTHQGWGGNRPADPNAPILR